MCGWRMLDIYYESVRRGKIGEKILCRKWLSVDVNAACNKIFASTNILEIENVEEIHVYN